MYFPSRIAEKCFIAIDMCHNIDIFLFRFLQVHAAHIDGNKRAAVLYANHYLIAHGQGFLVIPEAHVSEFKKLLAAYYEGEDPKRITDFLKTNCWKTF